MVRVNVVLVLTDYNKTSLAALAGAIESTAITSDVRIVVHDTRKSSCRIEEILALENPIVAFSFSTLSLIETAERVARLRTAAEKERRHDLILLAGGPHPTGAPEETLCLGFHYVIRGEGEVSFPLFIDAVQHERDYRGVPGLVWYDTEGRLLKNGRGKPVDLNAFWAIPRRLRLHSYLEITRGCRTGCRFCQTSYLLGTTLRFRSIERIIDEVGEINRTECKDIRLISPNALSYGSSDNEKPDLASVRTLLETIIGFRPNLNVYFGTFPSEIWPRSVSNEGLALIKEFACNDLIVVGAQSGSQRMLDRLHRGHTVDDCRQAIIRIRAHNLIPCVDFLFGCPGETAEDERLTIQIMQEFADLGARIHSHAFMPLAGTPLSEAPPGLISPQTIEALDRLAGYGFQFGTWRRQHAFAERVHRFRQDLARLGSSAAALEELHNLEYIPPGKKKKSNRAKRPVRLRKTRA